MNLIYRDNLLEQIVAAIGPIGIIAIAIILSAAWATYQTRR